MDKIHYLKHCTLDLKNILKEGYIISGLKAGKEKDIGDYSKIFLQIESYKNENKSLNYGGHCILLDKKILIERNDYVINGNGYKGIIDKNSLKKPIQFDIKFLNLINTIQNEVIFNNRISLKKYMIGIKYKINFDDKKDIRLDLIYNYNFKIYMKSMKNIYNLNNITELKNNYKKGKNIINYIQKYTNNIIFNYSPILPLFE